MNQKELGELRHEQVNRAQDQRVGGQQDRSFWEYFRQSADQQASGYASHKAYHLENAVELRRIYEK